MRGNIINHLYKNLSNSICNIFIKSGEKTFFCKIMPLDSADTLWVKNFVEIALSRSVSEINTFLHFTQKKWRENDFCEKLPVISTNTLWVKNFKTFKMAAKRGVKTIFEKSHQ